ncbi:MAG: type IV secretion protein IcmB [Desulfovibrio sp.]|jgi:intracellular multiplication protein IcmB|nr:type IV secretion protein IcmB [Desulfovibrio sp.]
MLDSLVHGIDRGIRALSETFYGPVGSYCKLETVDRGVLVADDGSLITVLRLEGALKQVGVDEYATIVRGLTEKLQSTLSRPGHCIQVVFEYDPEASGGRIREMLLPSRRTAQNLGLHIGPLLENWGQALERYCSHETCWMILWTRPGVLSEGLRKTALQERAASMRKAPMQPGCQQISAAIAALHDAHSGFVTGVLDAFRQEELLLYPLTPHEALRDIRICVDPEFTSREWLARIPGDALPLRLPDPQYEGGARSSALLHNVIYPDFKTQLWPREGHLLSRSAITVGDRVFGPLIMTLMPQTPKPFQEFFRVLSRRDERLPYRMSFLLEPGGLHMGMKPLLSGILAFASSDNKRFNNAVAALTALDLGGVCSVKFRICCGTWATIGTAGLSEKEAHLQLRRRMAELTKAIQGWGTTDVSEAVGDPLLGLAATVPAMMPSSPAPITAAPLQEAIGMLPLRSASPWKEGSLLLRTQDGKLFPFAPNSSEQAAWIDLGVAPMGGGKSVFLNAMNFAFVTQAGLSRLPWVSIIDVGPSSSGLITLIQENLPEGKKHMAAYHRLRMTEDFAINPFDTPLGCRQPLPSHMAFLVNLLTLLCTPLENTPPDKDVPGLVRRAIELAYEELSDKHQPRLYQSNVLPELHELLMCENIVLNAMPSWWEVVDALFERGFVHEAIQAQRYAVPLLGDLTTQINQNQGILNTYEEKTRREAWRSILDAITAYAVLKEPTRFDLGDAQIVSLDLDEVATRGGPAAERQSAVMYMLARHVLGARFFLMPDDVKLMPERYQDYHAERIEAIREDPKRICYDEAHRVTKNTSVSGQLEADMTTMARESRKWNLSIGLYTQSIDDIPKIIIELATTIVILGAGTDDSIKDMAERFGLNGSCRHALGHLGKPGPAGANLVALFRTGAGKSQLVLSLTIGGQALWAFSTTTEDVAIRNHLYKRMEPAEALRRLAARFPGGSAKSEVERRRRQVTDQSGADDAVVNVIQEIVHEIANSVRTS